MRSCKKKKNPFIIFAMFMIICFLNVCFLSVIGYQKDKFPEMYSESKIKELLLQGHPEYNIREENILNVSIKEAEDHKSFKAIVEIEKEEKEICAECYRVYYEFDYIDGSWVLKEGTDELIRREPKWLLENTSWSVVSENGSEYRISFVTETDASVSVTEKKEMAMAADDDLQKESLSDVENENTLETSVRNQKCKLEQVGHELSYAAKVERLDGTVITFLVNTERVSVDLGNGEGELIMKKD